MLATWVKTLCTNYHSHNKTDWKDNICNHSRKSVDSNNSMNSKESSILYLLGQIHNSTSYEVQVLRQNETNQYGPLFVRI